MCPDFLDNYLRLHMSRYCNVDAVLRQNLCVPSQSLTLYNSLRSDLFHSNPDTSFHLSLSWGTGPSWGSASNSFTCTSCGKWRSAIFTTKNRQKENSNWHNCLSCCTALPPENLHFKIHKNVWIWRSSRAFFKFSVTCQNFLYSKQKEIEQVRRNWDSRNDIIFKSCQIQK
jgi:hypothetical protein